MLVLSTLVAYSTLTRLKRRLEGGPSVAGAMVLGIYVLGPSLMFLEATLAGVGFHALKTVPYWWLYMPLSSAVPIFTLMLSGYDASIFALVFVTAFLVAARSWENGSWGP